MGRPSRRAFVLRQVGIVVLAVVAYFGVRGLTEGSVSAADDHGRSVLAVERRLGLDLELGLQAITTPSQLAVTLANWTYIWLHWPVLIGTMAWLLARDRATYLWLRNAMIVSGAIGLVLFATLPVTPPRLLGGYADTVTAYSHSYRVLQPPVFVNAYAALPSLHFGWNLLAGVVWFGRSRTFRGRAVAVAMPTAMGVAVVATGNHWVLDVILGGLVAGVGALVASGWMIRDERVVKRVARPRWADPGSDQPLVAPSEHRPIAVADSGRHADDRESLHEGPASTGRPDSRAGAGAVAIRVLRDVDEDEAGPDPR